MSPRTDQAKPARTRKDREKAPLPKELADFLIALSVAVHRYAIYPPEHPSTVPSTERVIRELAILFQERRALTLIVRPHQISVEGHTTSEGHSVITDLAQRLHDHQLGAVVFLSGVTVDEMEAFLRELASDPERDVRPLGILPYEQRPSWNHVRIYPLGYDVLETTEQPRRKEDALPVRALWNLLARVALQTGDVDPSRPADPREVAKSIRKGAEDPERAREVFSSLLDLTDELAWAEGDDAVEFRALTSEMIQGLAPEDVVRLARQGAGPGERRTLLQRASRSGLRSEAVVNLVEGVSHAEAKPISASFGRLLSKLSAHAEHGGRALRAEAEAAIRSNVERLISAWDLTDPNPGEYTEALDRLAQWSGPVRPSEDQALDLPDAERIVKMAIEVDTVGPTLDRALRHLSGKGSIAGVLRLCDLAPPESAVVPVIEEVLVTPEQLGRLLEGDDVDEVSMRILVDRLGALAVDPLFEHLVHSESRSVRRKVFDCLVSMEEQIADKALEYMDQTAWYVRRNMLSLLQEIPELPQGFSPLKHLRDPEPRVRREAFPLAIRDPATRPSALELALQDSDKRVVRMALLELQNGFPERLVPAVVERFLEGDDFPQFRSLVARALGESADPVARDALLRLCSSGRRILFWRRKLAPRSPELLAALHSLARGWAHDPAAGWALEAAGNSPDSQIRAAVETKEGDEPREKRKP